MSQNRVMFAGTGSGCGKTTVTCAIMKALCLSGTEVLPFKCGPDYIDPMFNSHITGRSCTNLDSFFMGEDELCWLMSQKLGMSEKTETPETLSPTDIHEAFRGNGKKIGIVEGVMGLFDGKGMTLTGSSFLVALWTNTPIILVVNARGMSLSLVAMIRGYVDFARKYTEKSLIRGVILNQASPALCAALTPEIEAQTGVKVVGSFQTQAEGTFQSRHLGLVTAGEIKDLDERMKALAVTAQSSIDLSLIKEIASQAAPLPDKQPDFVKKIWHFRKENGGRKIRMGIAMDQAFSFYYNTNLELLEALGVTLVPFSPLKDKSLPENISGLYIGGGYPELFEKELSQNVYLLSQIREKWEKGLCILAECGGFMYLHERMDGWPMAGIIPGSCEMTKKLGPFGYVTLSSRKAGIFGPEGTAFLGHEFHYSCSENPGSDWDVSKTKTRTWQEGFSSPGMYAGYPHLYFYSNVDGIQNFVRKMREIHDIF